MFVEDTDLKETDTLDTESEKKGDEEITEDTTVEDTKDAEDKTEDDTKSGDDEKEEDVEDVKDPYESKLEELKKENKRKGTALSEKNVKIKELKKQLDEQGLDKDEIKSVVDEVIGSKMQSIDETQKKLAEALEIASESNIDTLLSKFTKDDGEKKIFRHFLDTEVNKDLTLPKQIAQAVILGKDAMSDDKFQADVAKANEMSKRSTGRQGDIGTDIPEDVKVMGENLFPDKKAREKFYAEYRKDT